MTSSEKLQAKIDKRCHWHKWFAWYPVTFVVEKTTYRAWLEVVGRKDAIYHRAVDYSYITDVGCSKYCSLEDLVMNAIRDPGIDDQRDN